MSHFNAIARHPLTGKVEMALFMDDYYGRHRYGVRFPDGSIFDPEKHDIRSIAPPRVVDLLPEKFSSGTVP